MFASSSKKTILCACLDITKDEILQAVDLKCKDIETLKRFTGVGTGLCQGKFCYPAAILLLSEKTGRSPDKIGIPTPRQPVSPVPLGAVAQLDDDELDRPIWKIIIKSTLPFLLMPKYQNREDRIK
jgi:sarcosine oxidase, subunit beta